MHPAFSVIFFTTASGAGYGLLALLGIFGSAGMLPAERWFGLAGLFAALAMISLGLLASTFHLGHPERAWRAVTQWRSSWLAREGVVALITYVPAGLFAIGWVFMEQTDGWWGVMGAAAAVMAAVTVYCTSMIYRSLKTIHQWHNAWTSPVYMSLALMTGALLLNALTALFGAEAFAFKGLAIAALIVGWAVKIAYWNFIRTTASPITPQSAIGVEGDEVTVLELPHTSANYLNKEMGFKVARKHADKLRSFSHVTLFAVPLGLIMATTLTGGAIAMALSLLAVLSAGLGVIVERWLFFAEAKHVVNLYYGAQQV